MATESAEPIGKVVADLLARRVYPPRGMERDAFIKALAFVQNPTVVDATAIYSSLVAKDEPVYLYEDHQALAPPWDEAVVAYQNEHGNIVAMHSTVDHRSVIKPPWEPAHPVDWERVKWRIITFVWIGGRGAEGPRPTGGPAHCWMYAIYEDGTPADLHWVHLVPEYPQERWDMANLVLLEALNFMNCRNVSLVEPMLPRGERRRVALTGVKVQVINVFPTGKSSRGAKGEGGGVPLTSVRGHFASYGPAFGRGMLFGKYEGRFWHPQHARGKAELGKVESSYRLRPEER